MYRRQLLMDLGRRVWNWVPERVKGLKKYTPCAYLGRARQRRDEDRETAKFFMEFYEGEDNGRSAFLDRLILGRELKFRFKVDLAEVLGKKNVTGGINANLRRNRD